MTIPKFQDNLLGDDGEVVSLTRRPPFYPHKDSLVLISVRDWVKSRATARVEGLGKLKNPMTSLGIEPVTFRLVAYRLTQLRYLVPPNKRRMNK
jgi:hypothetical protein